MFNETGQPVEVLKVSDIVRNPGYRVVFSNGDQITTGEEHRWSLATGYQRDNYRRSDPAFQATRRAGRASRALAESQKPWVSAAAGPSNSRRADAARASRTRPSVWDFTAALTTREIFELVGETTKRLSVPLGRSIKSNQEWQAPRLPPWVMGMWLGDGSRQNCSISQSAADAPTLVASMARQGFHVHRIDLGNAYFFRSIDGSLLTAVSSVYGPYRTRGGKRIPDWVFITSQPDRLAVVQGLMDADGHAAADGGCEIDLTDERLFRDTVRLLSTLGIRVSVTTAAASYRVGEELIITGTRWRAKFATDIPVFTYSRKLARLRTGRPSLRSSLYVRAVEPCPTVPTRCVTVDSPRGLYLAGNTLIPTQGSRVQGR